MPKQALSEKSPKKSEKSKHGIWNKDLLRSGGKKKKRKGKSKERETRTFSISDFKTK